MSTVSKPSNARDAVKRAFAIRIQAAAVVDMRAPKIRAVLLGRRAW